MKLRILNKKIKADFLTAAKSSIKVNRARIPLSTTYALALAAYRKVVNENHPSTIGTPYTTRHLHEVGQGRAVRGSGRSGSRGSGGRGGRGHEPSGSGGRGQGKK